MGGCFVDSAEAARRLGIKRSSLYVYVSRGLLHSKRAPDGRRSLFLLSEVERLATEPRRRSYGERRPPAIATNLTELRNDGPYYRGQAASDLAGESSFEAIAELLWGVGSGEWIASPLDIPRGQPLRDLMRGATTAAAVADPWRDDLRPEAIARAARGLISSVVALMPMAAFGGQDHARRLAPLLASRLSPLTPSEGLSSAIDTALVLLCDPGPSPVTLAVRIAGSVRANLYDAMLAGLGVLGGSILGSEIELVYDFLKEADKRGAQEALAGSLHWGNDVPGLKDAPIDGIDAGFARLAPLIAAVAAPRKRRTLERVLPFLTEQDLPSPTVDFGIGSLMWAIEAPRDAGHILLAVARMAGWVGHYLEELTAKPLRFNPTAFAGSD